MPFKKTILGVLVFDFLFVNFACLLSEDRKFGVGWVRRSNHDQNKLSIFLIKKRRKL